MKVKLEKKMDGKLSSKRHVLIAKTLVCGTTIGKFNNCRFGALVVFQSVVIKILRKVIDFI